VKLVLRRVVSALITLWLAMTIAFVLARGIGDPVRQMLGPEATDARVLEVREELGLTLPLLTQYVDYFSQLLTGDLGRSLRYAVPNAELIMGTLPASIRLAVAAMALAIVLGVALGARAAVRAGGWTDRIATSFAFLAQSTPLFWVGMLLILVFAERLRWLPAGQESDWRSLILPAITLALGPLAKIALLTRSGMKRALREDYVMAARARGIAHWRIVWLHALRNATLPVITITALQTGALMSTAVTVELVFSWPGMGQLATSAVLARDYPLVQAIVLVAAAIFVGLNLIADLTYSLVDPRIRGGAR
jgi:peptide/nickel transport system permease protein